MRPEIMEGILRHIQPIGGTEKAKLLEIAPGHAKISIEITLEALNLYGSAHGGFLFSLCDMTAGMASYAYEMTNVTQCSSINYLRGIKDGTVYVEANALHRGKKTVVNQVNITDESGQIVATGNFTMFFTAPL